MFMGDMEKSDQRAVTKGSSCWVQLCVQLGGEELKSYMPKFLLVQFSFCFVGKELGIMSTVAGVGDNPGPWSSMTALLDEIILNTELFVPIHVLGDSLEEGITKLQLVVYNNYHL